MLRTWLSGALGALLLAVSASAQTDVDCASGGARGAWDLPAGRPAGYVKGVLVNDAGLRLVLEARLSVAKLPDGRRGGQLDGLLLAPARDGSLRAVAEAHGVYVLARDGRGTFESAILELPRSTGETQRAIGKLGGDFADPMRDGRDPVGRFVGRWAICR